MREIERERTASMGNEHERGKRVVEMQKIDG